MYLYFQNGKKVAKTVELSDLLIADLGKDGPILEQARAEAREILDNDPELSNPAHQNIKKQIELSRKTVVNWSRIS